jgi:tetratricopeptide (TPR) repeat protein
VDARHSNAPAAKRCLPPRACTHIMVLLVLRVHPLLAALDAVHAYPGKKDIEVSGLGGGADREAWWAAYHLSSLVELKSSRELFIDAHRLVDSFPDTAEAWYGVGCYYYLCGKFEKARINFLKATSLNPYFAPAWLLLSLLSSHTRPTAICRASLSCQGLRRDCVSGWAREQVRLWAYLCGAG